MKLFGRHYPGDNPFTGEKNPTHWTVLGVEMWRYRFRTEWEGKPYTPPRYKRFPWRTAVLRLGYYCYCFNWSYWKPY